MKPHDAASQSPASPSSVLRTTVSPIAPAANASTGYWEYSKPSSAAGSAASDTFHQRIQNQVASITPSSAAAAAVRGHFTVNTACQEPTGSGGRTQLANTRMATIAPK